MNYAKLVKKNLAAVDLKTRWNTYNPATGIRSCDFLSLTTLCGGYYANRDERTAIALHWCERMREHFPTDILVVEIDKYKPSEIIGPDDPPIIDDVPF